MSYKEIYEQAGLENAFLEHLEVQILKTSPLSANHGGGFVGSMYVPVCPKRLWIHHWLETA